eukprot:3226702-Rhodomonas_salina.1
MAFLMRSIAKWHQNYVAHELSKFGIFPVPPFAPQISRGSGRFRSGARFFKQKLWAAAEQMRGHLRSLNAQHGGTQN